MQLSVEQNIARNRSRPARRGFTLVEALIASTILAIVAASISLPFVAVAQQMNAAHEMNLAVHLGEELMEEVLARPFFAPGETEPSLGPEAGETERRYYNAVDDFNGYTEYKGANVDQQLTDYRGADIVDADMNGFHRRVSVQYVRLPAQAAEDSDYSFVRIKVQVRRYDRAIYDLVRIKAREY